MGQNAKTKGRRQEVVPKEVERRMLRIFGGLGRWVFPVGSFLFGQVIVIEEGGEKLFRNAWQLEALWDRYQEGPERSVLCNEAAAKGQNGSGKEHWTSQPQSQKRTVATGPPRKNSKTQSMGGEP